MLSSIISLVMADGLQAQNLVPNPSFEEALPNHKTRIVEANPYRPAFWEYPTRAKPDYYIKGKTGRFSTDLPGPQAGHCFFQGYVMAGIMGKSSPDSLNQYLQVKLKQKLIKDRAYCLSFNIRPRAYWPYCTDEIDYCLTATKIDQKSQTIGRLMVSNYNKSLPGGHFPHDAWSTLFSCYRAIGGEEYLNIGFINPEFKIIQVSGAATSPNKEVYVFIDNVILVSMDDISKLPYLQHSCECIESNASQPVTNDFNLAVNKPLILKNINFEIGKAKLQTTSFEELNALVLH